MNKEKYPIQNSNATVTTLLLHVFPNLQLAHIKIEQELIMKEKTLSIKTSCFAFKQSINEINYSFSVICLMSQFIILIINYHLICCR